MATLSRCKFLLRRIATLKNPSFKQKTRQFMKKDYEAWIYKVRMSPKYSPSTYSAEHYMVDKKKKAWDELRANQQFNSELRSRLGVELAVAHFILKGGGAVKFEGSEDWLDLQENPPWKRNVDRILPTQHAPAYKLEAIDASKMPIMYDTFDSFTDLGHIKYLSVSECPYFDDWCFERLNEISMTLMMLDVSGCPQVTERGLATLHKMPNLRRLVCYDMPKVRNPPVVKLMLEDMLPNVVVDGLADYRDPAQWAKVEPEQEPVPLVPPPHVIQLISQSEWIHVDDPLFDDDEEEEKQEAERRLLYPGTGSESDPTVSGKR